MTSSYWVKDTNKCIGDNTKAAARQTLNCLKNHKKIKYGEKRFSIWRMEFLHHAMWHDHDIDFVPCDTRLWNDMQLNSPKRPPYWHSISGFDFDHMSNFNSSASDRSNSYKIIQYNRNYIQYKYTFKSILRHRIFSKHFCP